MRRLAVELRPKALDDFGLVPALERLAETFAEQTGLDGRLRVRARRGASAERGRDRALPRGAGGAHERRQARAREQRQHRAHAQGRRSHGRHRGRRRGLRPRETRERRHRSRRHARARWRCSTGGSTSSRLPGVGHDARRRGALAMSDARPHRRRPRGRADRAAARCSRPRTTSRRSARRGTARDAIFEARALKPDVILLDVVMPGGAGSTRCRSCIHEHPEAKVLVLSMQDDPQLRAGGVRVRRERLRPEGGGRHRGGGRRSARSRPAGGTSTPSSARAWSSRRRKPLAAPMPIRCPSASTRCCGCSRSGTRTRRSRSSSTSRCARRRRTARTSCRSSGCTSRAELVRYALANGLIEQT